MYIFCVCLKLATIPSAQSLHLLDFSFSDFDLSDSETTLATVRMFVDLHLVQNFQMKYTVRTDLGFYTNRLDLTCAPLKSMRTANLL